MSECYLEVLMCAGYTQEKVCDSLGNCGLPVTTVISIVLWNLLGHLIQLPFGTSFSIYRYIAMDANDYL